MAIALYDFRSFFDTRYADVEEFLNISLKLVETLPDGNVGESQI